MSNISTKVPKKAPYSLPNLHFLEQIGVVTAPYNNGAIWENLLFNKTKSLTKASYLMPNLQFWCKFGKETIFLKAKTIKNLLAWKNETWNEGNIIKAKVYLVKTWKQNIL